MLCPSLAPIYLVNFCFSADLQGQRPDAAATGGSTETKEIPTGEGKHEVSE